MKALVLLAVCCGTLISQSKEWRQSTIADFSAGTPDSTEVSAGGDGEVRLQHPFVQLRSDTLNMPVQRFVSYASSGAYLKAWVSSKQVMVQKFSASHQSLSSVIPVNDRLRTDGDNVGIALMDDGAFAVTWAESVDSSNGYSYSLRYVQFYTAANERIGTNRRIFNAPNATHSIPQPIADNLYRRYLIVGAEGNATAGFVSYGWFFRDDGVRIGDSLKIVPSSVTKNEYHIRGVNHRGRYLLTWAGDNTNTGPNDVYAMFLDSLGSPLSGPVLMNSVYKKAVSPIGTFDSSGNAAVIWIDQRYNLFGNVYVQLFDSAGRKIAGEKALTKYPTQTRGGIYYPDIAWKDHRFHISWNLSYSDGQPAQVWIGFWRIGVHRHGMFTSAVFDAGNSQIHYDSLLWNSTEPGGTALRLQLRTGNSPEQINAAAWHGSDAAHAVYTSGSGSPVNPVHHQHRYIQYRAWLNSDTMGVTPSLNDITLRYRSLDTIAPAPPAVFSAAGEHRKVTLSWQSSISGDVKLYRIYRTTEGGQFPSQPLAVTDGAATILFDSTAVTGTLYRYAIQAVDSTLNASPAVVSSAATPRTMTIYVSRQGTSTGDGSMAKPMASIMSAMAYAGMKDTVFVLPGEYTGPVTVKDFVSLIGSGMGSTRILFTEAEGNAVTAGSNTVVKGFTMLVTTGVRCAGNNVTITENALLHQGTDWHVGISTGFTSSGVGYTGIVISRNFIMDFWMGIHTLGGSTVPTNVTLSVRNNIIRSSVGIQVVRNRLDVISNTFIVQGTNIGITFAQGAATVMNNCFAGYPQPGYPLRSMSRSSASVYIDYNNFWNFPGDNDSLLPSNIRVDPQFVNAARNRFSYKNTSPCIDAGNPHPAYNDPDGTRNDLGAYGSPNALPSELSIQTPADLAMTNSSGFAGDTVAVMIRAVTAAGLAAFECDLEFDPELAAFRGIRAVGLPAGGTLSSVKVSERVVRLRIDREEELTAPADLAAVEMIIRSDLSTERRSSLEFGNVSVHDADGQRIAVNSLSSGMIIGKVRSSDTTHVWVDGGYTGPMDGTIGHPFVTVQQGIDHAAEGDTVMVAAGIYEGNIVMKSGIVVKGMGANVTVLQTPDDPGDPNQWVVKFKDVVNSGLFGCALVNLTHSGSTIDVENSTAVLKFNKFSTDVLGSYSVYVRNGSHVVFSDNVFTEHETSIGSMLTVNASTGTFTRNTFFPRGGMEAVLFINTHDVVFSNNSVIAEAGTMNLFRETHCTGTVIRNNLFLTQAVPGEGLWSEHSVGTKITNNIFDIKNIAVRDLTSNIDVRNNIFIGNAMALVLSDSSEHRYNLFWEVGTPVYGKPMDATEVRADPLFVNRASLNYTLSSGSPARDGGDPAVQYRDADATRNDIGLFGGPDADHASLFSARSRLSVGIMDAGTEDTVVVPVIGKGLAGISGLQTMIQFDEQKIILADIHTAASVRDFQLLRKNIGASIVMASIAGHTTKTVDSLPILLLTFVVRRNASGFAAVSIGSAEITEGHLTTMPVGTLVGGGINLGPASAGTGSSFVPERFALHQNYPNPFNPSTRIEYSLPQQSAVTVTVYDVIGRQVAVLVNEVKNAGRYAVEWDGTNGLGRAVSSGVYFCRFTAGNNVHSRKMVLLK